MEMAHKKKKTEKKKKANKKKPRIQQQKSRWKRQIVPAEQRKHQGRWREG